MDGVSVCTCMQTWAGALANCHTHVMPSGSTDAARVHGKQERKYRGAGAKTIQVIGQVPSARARGVKQKFRRFQGKVRYPQKGHGPHMVRNASHLSGR